MLLCHSRDNKIKSQRSLYWRSKAVAPLTGEDADAKLIQQVMKQNISSLKRKNEYFKDKGLMMCWLYIILLPDIQRYAKKSTMGHEPLSADVLWLAKLVARAVTICIKK